MMHWLITSWFLNKTFKVNFMLILFSSFDLNVNGGQANVAVTTGKTVTAMIKQRI